MVDLSCTYLPNFVERSCYLGEIH